MMFGTENRMSKEPHVYFYTSDAGSHVDLEPQISFHLK